MSNIKVSSDLYTASLRRILSEVKPVGCWHYSEKYGYCYQKFHHNYNIMASNLFFCSIESRKEVLEDEH